MGIPVIDTGPFTVEEFYAFTDARPDEEKWELIEGELVLNASPAVRHQWIVRNLIIALGLVERQLDPPWAVIPGIGALVSNISRPEPDVMIVPKLGPGGLDATKRDTAAAAVLFEVMSPSTRSRDLKWKRAAYTGLAALTHYVVIAQDAVDVVVFARDSNFAEQRLRSRDDTINFSALGVSLALADIYRDINFA